MARRKALTELHVALTASTQKFAAKMKGARSSITKVQKTSKSTQVSMRKLAVGFAAVTAAAATTVLTFRKLTRSFEEVDKLAKTSAKLGLTTNALVGLRHAANQTGVASDTLDMALQRMVRRVSEAALGTGEAVAAIRELGIDAKKLAALSPEKQFREIADAINRVESSSDRVRLAFKLFDSEGVSLLNTLRLGSDGLQKMDADARRLGISIGTMDARKVEVAADAMDRVRKSIEGISLQFAVGLAPAIAVIAEDIASMVATMSGMGGGPVGMVGRGVGGVWNAGKTAWSNTTSQVAGMGGGLLDLTGRAIGSETRGGGFLRGLGAQMTGVSMLTEAVRDADASRGTIAERVAKRQKELTAALEEATDGVKDFANTVVDLDIDPVARSMRIQGMEPITGPPLPDDYAPPSSNYRIRRDEPFYGPEQPGQPRRRIGGAQIISNLSNLATGTYANTASDPKADRVFRFFDYLENGNLNVILAGVET